MNFDNIQQNNKRQELRLKILENYCEHNKLKKDCISCNNEMCEHNKIKSKCRNCQIICKTDNCDKIANIKCNNYCRNCYKNLFKKNKEDINFRKKEKIIIKEIINKFPNFTWIKDKPIEWGKSNKRPDLLCDFGYQVMIIEIDEYSHRKYDKIKEENRDIQLLEDTGYRPIIFIRFNPDNYITKTGKIVQSCWHRNNKTRDLEIRNNKKNEWNNRINKLLETIEFWSMTQSNEIIKTIKLFYDEI